MKLSENKGKRKTFGSEAKRKYALLISLWSEEKNSKRNEAKRSEKNVFFHVSVRNACETDLVSLRFALKRKKFFGETGAP
jgi:ABC-type transporter MlaC component